MGTTLPEGAALLTPAEARAQLRISDSTLRKLDRERRLVALRVGGKARRYRQSDIDQYLNSIAAHAAQS